MGRQARQREPELEHLLRRAGFGASDQEIAEFTRLGLLGFTSAVGRLLNYREIPDDVDSFIGRPGYVGITARSGFAPTANINDARQRWLFRMVHSQPPSSGEDGALLAQPLRDRVLEDRGRRRSRPKRRGCWPRNRREDPGGVKGQLELLREHALGNFRDLLVAIAQDPAMLFWLDGRTNVRARPQENFARELMELFTMGVGHVHRGGRLRGRAGLHRLEPGPRRAAARHGGSSSTTTPRSTTPRRRNSASRSTRTATARFPRDQVRRGCRTASI